MISNIAPFTILALALLASMSSVFAEKEKCNPTAGYQYCAAQGCVRPLHKSTNKECCKELKGFEWQSFVGGRGGACDVKETSKPVPAQEKPKPNPNKDARRLRVNCGVGTGMEYCPAQGCVHPWNASERCCRQLEGFKWEQQFGGGSCVARNNHQNRRPSNKCGRGKRYCEDQGCVYPTDLYTSKSCCKELRGVHWNRDPNGAKCVWN